MPARFRAAKIVSFGLNWITSPDVSLSFISDGLAERASSLIRIKAIDIKIYFTIHVVKVREGTEMRLSAGAVFRLSKPFRASFFDGQVAYLIGRERFYPRKFSTVIPISLAICRIRIGEISLPE